MAIARACAVEQGKGGVGKTTVVTNVGGLAAAAGVSTLIVDLDPQGNTARDLGYQPSDGQALLTAIMTGGPLPLLKDVRPQLDVVPGGPNFADVTALASSWNARSADSFTTRLETAVSRIAHNYDLILIDTPPGDRMISEGALGVVTSVVIPTRSDDASIDGVVRVAERFAAVKDINPTLRLAGVVLFAVGSRSLRLERQIRNQLDELLGGVAPVFETRIRHLESAAADARRHGLLIHELEQEADQDQMKRIAALKSGAAPGDGLFVRNASGLAGDFESLTRELLAVIGEIQREADAA